MPKLKPGTHIPSEEEDKHINAGIDADPDSREINDEEFKRMKPMGRPKAEVTKERISIRLSPEVVEAFRSTGRGWQTRLDHALKEYLHEHSTDHIKRLN